MNLKTPLTIALSLALLLTACKGSAPKPIPPPPTVQRADFKVMEVKVADPLDRGIQPAADIKLVTDLVNGYYTAAFLLPSVVTSTFTAEAQPQAITNLDTLTIGGLGKDIKRMVASVQEITRASFFVENDSSIPQAIVEMRFEAKATMKPERGGKQSLKRSPTNIVHTAKFWLQKHEGAFQISAFAADLKADSIAPPTKPKATASTAKSPSALEIHKVQTTQWRPEVGGPVFILVLGSDARNAGPDGGRGRCDAIHLVGINPTTKSGSILNFPRDSYVDVPGHGMQRINTSCFYGGPDLMVKTMTQLTNIPIHYYVITEFSHFRAITEELGGVEVDIPYPMNDPVGSGAQFAAGPHLLSGEEALRFNRNRHDTPNGDFSRTANQATFMLASLKKFRTETQDLSRMFDYFRVARRHTLITVPLNEMLRLGFLAQQIDPGAIQSIVINGSTGKAGDASVVFLNPGDIFSRVRDDALP
ncbi:MAG: LCP family protein [Actinomycetota bacterium]